VNDLWAFLAALWRHWLAIVTAGVVGLVLLVVEKWRQKDIPTRVYLMIAAGAMIFASFLSWRTEFRARKKADLDLKTARREVKEARDELTALRNKDAPSLLGTIRGGTIGISRDQPTVPALILVVSVRNLGTPSIAANWQATIDVPGRPAITTTPMAILKPIEIFVEKHRQIFGKDDALDNKAVRDPIPRVAK
jgi:hypothetical protein